jgi:hypothetical protein
VTKRVNRPSLQVMLLCLLAALCMGALAACTQATDTGIPTVRDSQEAAPDEANAAQAETTPTAQDPQEAGLAHSKCMREHGLTEWPDPDAQGRIRLRLGSIDPESAEFRAASDACGHLAPEGWGDAASDPRDAEVLLEFARCMRENGVPDYPDPEPDGAVRIRLNANDPKAQAAFERCQTILEGLQRAGG